MYVVMGGREKCAPSKIATATIQLVRMVVLARTWEICSYAGAHRTGKVCACLFVTKRWKSFLAYLLENVFLIKTDSEVKCF